MSHLSAPESIADFHTALHTLQAEALRFDAERVNWNVQRAELQSTVARLEALVETGEAMQNDLLRRTKMLEWALKQERLRHAQATGSGDNGAAESSTAAAVPIADDAAKAAFAAHGSVAAVQKLGTSVSRLAKPRASHALVRRYMEELQLSHDDAEVEWATSTKDGGAASTEGLARVQLREQVTRAPSPPPGVRPPAAGPTAAQRTSHQRYVALLARHGVHVAPTVPHETLATLASCFIAPPASDAAHGGLAGPVRPASAPAARGDDSMAAGPRHEAAGSSSGRYSGRSKRGRGRGRRLWVARGSASSDGDTGESDDATGAGTDRPGNAGDGATGGGPEAGPPGSAWRNTNNFPGMRRLKIAPGSAQGGPVGAPGAAGATATPSTPPSPPPDHPVGSMNGDPPASGSSAVPLTGAEFGEVAPWALPPSAYGARRSVVTGAVLPVDQGDSPTGTATAAGGDHGLVSPAGEEAGADLTGSGGGAADGSSPPAPTSVGQLLDELRSVARPSHSWKPKMTLRGHLEVVRQLAWHPKRPLLFSASDDGTVKAWNLASLSRAVARRSDIDPTRTYRGHTAEVLCVAVACNSAASAVALARGGVAADLLVTGGADGAVMVWRVPAEGEPTSAYAVGASCIVPIMTLVGHTNAVWDVAAASAVWKGESGEAVRVYSVSADGTLRAWLVGTAIGSPLHQTFRVDSLLSTHDVVPTCVAADSSSSTCVYFGTNHGALACLDTESGSLRWHVSRTGPASPGVLQSINKIVVHPSLRVLVAATNDKAVRLVDGSSGATLRSISAHRGPVSGVAVDPSGLLIVSVAHTGAVRWWSITDSSCTQEITAHRAKWGEGALAVAFHPSAGMLASAGADACIKLFQ